MTPLIENIFRVAQEIRYVATYLDNILDSAERPGLAGASDSEITKRLAKEIPQWFSHPPVDC